MTLSVVIVNYNVKYFLEQCLISVFKSMRGIKGEVFVVDNASADGSCQMVKERFPQVHLIENYENYGFSYANNQALRLAQGEFVLVLNPDTVVEEDTFSKCIAFMQSHPQAGSLSVKMIDGKGNFLPESKRAMPSPMVSFYKIFGFSKVFPHSPIFARYHLGHLSENQINEIEILPGAFMFIRNEALKKAGLFDESFFMYGEDIDLSYRIIKAGYKNYYFPETTIIHYKGESTKKGSINYVLVFYKAMMIFARKHFNKTNTSIYILLIYFAIYIRAGLSIARRVINRLIQPTIDIAIILSGFAIIIPYWGMVRYNTPDIYSSQLVSILTILYTLIWITCLWLLGSYDRPQKVFSAAKGILVGTISILILYALLPETMRFSRAIILITATWATIMVQVAHLSLGIIRKDFKLAYNNSKRIVIIGNSDEVNRVLEILKESVTGWILAGSVSPNQNINSHQLGSLNQLDEIIRVNSVDEIIFCAGDISSQDIIKTMLRLVSLGVDFKIAPPDSISVIGSNSIDTSGDLYTIEISAISKPSNVRSKRLFDIGIAIIVILLSPLLSLISKVYRKMLRNSIKVIIGKYSWVGYDFEGEMKGLPKIKKGVFTTNTNRTNSKINKKYLAQVNIDYAKNYNVLKDLLIVWNQIANKLR